MAGPPRFLVRPDTLQQGPCQLPADEARHAACARRLRPGQPVELFDGAGRVGQGVVSDVSAAGVTATVERIEREPPPGLRLVLSTAIPKGKRWQTLVEKCTELGVWRIEPVWCARATARGEGDPGKWQRWAREASKQSRRVYVPRIDRPVDLSRLLAGDPADLSLLAHPGAAPVGAHADRICEAHLIRVLIGPEGGLTDEEHRACQTAGFQSAGLGPHILRVETAALAACALVHAVAENFSARSPDAPPPPSRSSA
jgi:16S rRNA (uracil1498-N3)-methyltransferase